MRTSYLVRTFADFGFSLPICWEEAVVAKMYNITLKRLQPIDAKDDQCELLLESDSDQELSVAVQSGSEDCFCESSSSEGGEEEFKDQMRQYTTRRHDHHSFLGREVCRGAHQRLLGIGAGTVQALRQGQRVFTNQDRIGLPQHPGLKVSLRTSSNNKWPRILLFLWLLYHSAAEVLPTKFRMPSGYVQEGEKKDEEDEDLSDRYVSSFLQKLDDYHNMPDLNAIGPGTFHGPRRFLQHRKRIDVYYEYVAYEESADSTPASFATFLRVFNAVYRDHLRFRSKGEHAECSVCNKLKRDMAKATAADARDRAYRQYSQHILAQWFDRQCYWSVRSLSQTWFRALARNQ